MYKLQLIELFLRGIPEELVFIWFCYVISRTKLNTKRFIISTVLMTVCVYFVRMLPIHFSNIALINICILTIINIFINKISIVKSIIVTIISMVVESLCEVVMFAVYNYFNISMDFILNTTTYNKLLYAFPSLVIFALIVLVIKFILDRKTTKNTHEIENMFYN